MVTLKTQMAFIVKKTGVHFSASWELTDVWRNRKFEIQKRENTHLLRAVLLPTGGTTSHLEAPYKVFYPQHRAKLWWLRAAYQMISNPP